MHSLSIRTTRQIHARAHRSSRVAVLCAVGAVSACSDQSPAPIGPVAGRPQSTISTQAPSLLTIDEIWAQIAANEIPGFAGIVGDGNGVDEVLLTDEAQRPNAEAYARRIRQDNGLPPGLTRVRRVEFGFDQLMTWRLQLLSLLGTSGIHSLDIDEVRNRVVLGVRAGSDIDLARSLGTGAGLPAGALVVEVTPVVKPRVALTDEAPSAVGGYEISSPAGICSLGFNTYTAGSSGSSAFITASHCSTSIFANDGTTFAQPFGGHSIGTEFLDPPLFTGYWTFNGRSGLCNGCRFSDATLVSYNSGIAYQFGALAKTDGWGYQGRGSLVVASNWKIFNKLSMEFLTVGRWLNKVGRTSGWTRGQVTRTCVDHSDGPGVMLCQWDSNIWSEHGDSGSPIFLDSDTHPPAEITYIHLAGLLWGGPEGDWNTTWFSSLNGIDRDFGRTFKVCSPDIASC